MRAWKVIVSCVAVGALTLSTLAQNEQPGKQPPRGRPTDRQPGDAPPRGQPRGMLTPEQSKAAWELEANGVAKRLGLSEEQTKSLVKAYADARESYGKASQKLREDMRDKMRDADDPRAAREDMRKAMDEMNKSEREKLEKAISSSLSADQTTKAVASLGTFNVQWDRMASTIADFKLEPAKQQDALVAIEDFVVAQSKVRPFDPNADREAARTAMQEAHTKLNDSLKKVLSEEQLKKFDESIRFGRGMGPGGPGGPDDGNRPQRRRNGGG